MLTALAGDVGFWTGGRFPPGPYDSYAEFIESLAIEFRSALRESPLLQRVLAWELIQPSDTLRRIDQLRSKAIIAWMADARGELAPPPGVDAPAINAILLAAIRYLALAKVSLGRTAGIDLTSPENEARIDAAFRQLIRLAYEAPKSPKQDA
ncbi:MAG: hypothetical protein HC850_10700 [Rhodomicrobium sp.]|nr:hypothetical protein [Rhodomicrobium sp.]